MNAMTHSSAADLLFMTYDFMTIAYLYSLNFYTLEPTLFHVFFRAFASLSLSLSIYYILWLAHLCQKCSVLNFLKMIYL
jgi:hypothetical protein